MRKNWVPEICYEEDPNGMSSHIPFIQVPDGEQMPRFLLIFESRETGEFEPGEDGEPLPIFDMELKQFADMSILKEKLKPKAYDEVRKCLGLEPLKSATEKGKNISETIRNNLA